MIGAMLDDRALLERLSTLPDRADSALTRAAESLTDRLLGLASGNLSGSVLKARTGTLRASLRATVATGGAIAASVTASAPYAAFQEYGFSGVENVRASARRQSRAFGRAISPVVVAVRAHQRRVDYPGRSYLRSALAALAPEIGQAIRAAVAQAVES
jgi:hypothetical protein